MTVAELTAVVVSRLREQNDGRDITRQAYPIIAVTMDELAKAGYLDLKGPLDV